MKQHKTRSCKMLDKTGTLKGLNDRTEHLAQANTNSTHQNLVDDTDKDSDSGSEDLRQNTDSYNLVRKLIFEHALKYVHFFDIECH